MLDDQFGNSVVLRVRPARSGMGSKLSKKNATIWRVRGLRPSFLAWAATPSLVSSMPASAAWKRVASGMVCQNRYDRRVAISRPATRLTSLFPATGVPISTRYRNSGACSSTSIMAATPEPNVTVDDRPRTLL